jgi:hypothetical protein
MQLMKKGGTFPINNVDIGISCDFSSGSPGAIPLFTLAAEVFPELQNACLEAAV